MELELNKIRELGMLQIMKKMKTGVTCLACPIFDINSNVILPVSISLSTARLNQIGKDILLMHLKQTAQSISKELGGVNSLPLKAFNS